MINDTVITDILGYFFVIFLQLMPYSTEFFCVKILRLGSQEEIGNILSLPLKNY